MKVIPLSAIPAETFQIVLDDQQCRITLYQRGRRMYLDLDVDNEPVCRGGDMSEPGIHRPVTDAVVQGVIALLGHAWR